MVRGPGVTDLPRRHYLADLPGVVETELDREHHCRANERIRELALKTARGVIGRKPA